MEASEGRYESDQGLARLRKFTEECRPDMHEPDEQGIYAEFGPSVIVVRVVRDGQRYYKHPGLDNASTGESDDMGFWLIRKDQGGEIVREWFNLANIIALARRAV